MDVTRHREVSTLKTYDRLSNMQEKPFCDFRRRVVSADRVFMRARGRAHLWSDMAKHSQGNITDAPFEIDNANWRLIEEAYGASLPPNVRADIVRATEVFFFSENFARTGEPTATVKVILEAHDKAATRFFNELFGSPSSFSDAGVYAHSLIDSNFKPPRLGSDKEGLDALLDLLRAFHIACNTAIKQLNDPSTAHKGKPWKIWLNRLAEIVAEVKSLRGKGGDESKVDHPLVQFVREMQNCLPSECQRDQAAIEQALLEAQQNPQKTKAENIREGRQRI